jgi:molybdenum cofactor cytidylyltransferase
MPVRWSAPSAERRPGALPLADALEDHGVTPLVNSAQAQLLPTVLVLASGLGARFTACGGSGHKLQADLAGKSVLQHTLDAVHASGLRWHLEDAGHPGMGDSIAAALRATADAAGWLVLPGDLPLIAAQTLLLLAQVAPGAEVLLPVFHGQHGHPVRFTRSCGAALAGLQGQAGAARVLAQCQVRRWPVADLGCVTDIDTLANLERARALL